MLTRVDTKWIPKWIPNKRSEGCYPFRPAVSMVGPVGFEPTTKGLRVYAVADPDARKRAAKTIDEAYSETLSDVIEFRKAQ